MCAAKRSSSKDNAEAHSPVIENRKARFDYIIVETLETGMSLTGSEVKSIRDGKASLAEGFVRVEGGMAVRKTAAKNRRPSALGLFLHQVNIAEYPPAGPVGSVGQHHPTRVRPLLAHRREITRLAKEVQVKGVTIVPLKIYFLKGKAKLLIGLAKGKTHADKRETIAKRDAQRDMARAMSKRV